MSGWIKWEKDLPTDPRMIRMVRELKRTSVTGALTSALQERSALATVCGALLLFWSYADSHIRADDTIDLGPADIDELVGIDGFAKSMPEDWLRVVDDQTVELPNFQSHNNVEAKKKAQAQKRVETHRLRKRNADETPQRNNSVTGALPDQTRPRPDHTRPPSEFSDAPNGGNGKVNGNHLGRAQRLPDGWQPDHDDLEAMAAQCPSVDLDRELLKFTDYWRGAAGQRGVKRDWRATYRNWMRKAQEDLAAKHAPRQSRYDLLTQGSS
ncbi:MAG: hypothetical protein U1F35_05275 [Steroidobacteraceae bacterium]